MIGIYKITSPNKRIYIGQSVNISKRWKQHKYQKLDTFLCRSFNKYGFENHFFEVIEECPVELLNERERYWQDYYEVLKYGLNCKLTKTNDKSGYVSEQTKLKTKINRIDKKPDTEYVFEHENFINDYEEKIFEYYKQREIEEQEKQKQKEQEEERIEWEREFYWIRYFEEEERRIDSLSI